MIDKDTHFALIDGKVEMLFGDTQQEAAKITKLMYWLAGKPEPSIRFLTDEEMEAVP